jgi:hypothetical protein
VPLTKNSLKKFWRAVGQCFRLFNVERKKPIGQSVLRSLGCQPLTQLKKTKYGPGNNNWDAACAKKLDNVCRQAHMMILAARTIRRWLGATLAQCFLRHRELVLTSGTQIRHSVMPITGESRRRLSHTEAAKLLSKFGSDTIRSASLLAV